MTPAIFIRNERSLDAGRFQLAVEVPHEFIMLILTSAELIEGSAGVEFRFLDSSAQRCLDNDRGFCLCVLRHNNLRIDHPPMVRRIYVQSMSKDIHSSENWTNSDW